MCDVIKRMLNKAGKKCTMVEYAKYREDSWSKAWSISVSFWMRSCSRTRINMSCSHVDKSHTVYGVIDNFLTVLDSFTSFYISSMQS